MNIYSHIIGEFIAYLEKLTKDILSREMKLKVTRRYFEYQKNYYPIKFTIFEANSPLGEFVPSFYQININKFVMSWNEADIKNLLRHEILHYICHLHYGDNIDAHGVEFRRMGQLFGYSEEVTKALWQVDAQEIKEQEKKKAKVDKLLRLSQSSNMHEAQLALKKAKKMMNHLPLFNSEDEFYYVKALAKFKRSNTKIKIISHILDTFELRCVTNYGKDFAYLEVTGKKVHIEYADYLYTYLDRQLEYLWKKARAESKLSGITEKNSFLWGFWSGYSKQIEKEPIRSKDLMKREKELDIIVDGYYRKVSRQRQTSRFSQKAHQAGQKSARGFQINNPINHQSKRSLTYEG